MYKAFPQEMKAGDDIPLHLLHLYLQRLTTFMTQIKASMKPGTRIMFRTTAMPRYSNCKCQCEGTSQWSMGSPTQITEMNQAGRAAAQEVGLEIIDFDQMLQRYRGGDHGAYLRDAIHPKESFLLTALNMALNMFFFSAPVQPAQTH